MFLLTVYNLNVSVCHMLISYIVQFCCTGAGQGRTRDFFPREAVKAWFHDGEFFARNRVCEMPKYDGWLHMSDSIEFALFFRFRSE
jgi:hypothetical protein